MSVQPPTSAARAGKYLTFVLGDEEYGLEIVKVREILGVMPITPIPQVPHFVKGVINLRGKVIPVVDTRSKFGMPEAEPTSHTCIIVVEVNGRSIGIVVDTVKEVMDVAEEQVEDTPNIGQSFDGGFILGIAKVAERVNILLDIDALLVDLELAGMGDS